MDKFEIMYIKIFWYVFGLKDDIDLILKVILVEKFAKLDSIRLRTQIIENWDILT